MLRVNETFDDFFNRCNNISIFDCSENEMLWWLMGSKRLPLDQIVPITVLLVVIFVSGVVGNICVCVVIIRQECLHTATNYYLFNLAISDLLLLFFGLPNDLLIYWDQYPYKFGKIFCKFRALISETLQKRIALQGDEKYAINQEPQSSRQVQLTEATYASVLTISAFSLERYLAICHPLHTYAMAGLTRASRIIGLLWMLSIISASPFAVFVDVNYKDYPPNSGNISMQSAFCSLTTSSPLLELSSVFFFFVPAVLILCLYVRMALHIRRTQNDEKRKLNLLNGQVHGETRQIKSRKIIIRMLAAVVVAFFVCWAPFHVQRLFIIYGAQLPHFHLINEHLFNIAGALYYVSATVNPILYNVMSGRYRIAFRETLFCSKPKKRTSDQSCFTHYSLHTKIKSRISDDYSSKIDESLFDRRNINSEITFCETIDI